MAESVDALVSNTSGAIRAGSTPAQGTEKGVEQSAPFFLNSLIMIPSIKNIELPLLQILAEHSPRTWDECTEVLSKHFNLTVTESQMLTANGKCKAMKYRVGWAKANLKRNRLLIAISRGVYAITDLGLDYLHNLHK